MTKMIEKIYVKGLVLACVTLAMSVALAVDLSDQHYGYHSTGTDKYADGSTVLDGECYALIWMSEGSDFKGFYYDGSLVDAKNNDLIHIRSLAEGGRCPPVDFIVSDEIAKAHPKGSYKVVVLDTRCTKGALAGLDENGDLVRVNGWGWANVKCDSVKKSSSTSAGAAVADSILAALVDKPSRVPADCARPRITAISIDDDGNVHLRFKGTERYLSYYATQGGTLESADAERSDEVIPGAGNVETEMSVVIQKKQLPENAGFMLIKAENWGIK